MISKEQRGVIVNNFSAEGEYSKKNLKDGISKNLSRLYIITCGEFLVLALICFVLACRFYRTGINGG